MPHWRMMMVFTGKWNQCTQYIITVLCSKQTPSPRHFRWVLSYSKNTPFRGYCMPIVEQIHTDLVCLRLVWSAFMLHIIMSTESCAALLRNQLSVRPHQVSHCVRTFDALLRNNLYWFFICCATSSNFLYDRFNFLYDRFKCLMLLFLQIFIFPQLFDTPVWWRPTAIVVGASFWRLHLNSIVLCSSKNHVCNVYKANIRKVRNNVETLIAKSYFKVQVNKLIDCWSHDKCVETLIGMIL